MSKRKRATTTKKATPKASTRTQGSRPARGSRYVATFMAPGTSGRVTLNARDAQDAYRQMRDRYPDALSVNVDLD